ncbi:MAG TPA: DUF2461 domain-containing protein [Bdellovibrionota bacterium]|nr:DUF2461 domain-containing protein [Bdellovibrionota bacterium]
MAYFESETLSFLRALKRNNRRPWFLKNKPRYEEFGKEPMIRLIADLKKPISAFAPWADVDPKPNGGSMMRIYRDIRFSKDKSPYKTHLSAHFPHRHSDDGVHGPGYYLHLEPGGSFAGGGVWHPEPKALRMIRDAIRSRPEAWLSATAGLEVEGDKLKRPPQGVSPDDPLIEDLKLKDFFVTVEFSDKDVCSKNFPQKVIKAYQSITPMMRFLSEAVRLPW